MIRFYYLLMGLITGDITDYNFQKRKHPEVFCRHSLSHMCLISITGTVISGIKYGNNEIQAGLLSLLLNLL